MSKQSANLDGRTEVVFVRMTPAEKAQLEILARGQTKSDFLRWLVSQYYEVSRGNSAKAS